MLKRSLVLAAAVAGVGLVAGTASADPWTFGVISDTQDTLVNGTSGTNTCATHIIGEVNKQFVAQNVAFVVQPGDLADNGTVASLQSRLDANAGAISGVTGLGSIPFYGLRGNHEDNSACQTFFNTNYIPASTAGAVVSQQAGTSNYSVTVNGTKIIMLDILTADSTAAMDSATTWMNGQLSAADHTQAFVFQHKDLIGQNHHDNAFQTGSNQDDNPTQQNNFFQALATNNVKYDICGHDHMNHRSIVASPNGQYKVQEIISQSDSTKFYTPATPADSRETSISDQQNMIGYYTYTVDGPRVTGKYYATPVVNSDIGTNPVWTLEDTFGYSLNGKQFTIARGGSYNGVSDAISAGLSSYGETFLGTSMSLSGANTVTATTAAPTARAESDDLNTGWAPAVPGGAMVSDILTLWGMNNGLGADTTDPYTLTMSYAPGTASPMIEHQNADASWTLLPTVNNGDGTVSAAGLTFDGNFAVAVPEPASLSLLGFGALGLLARRRRA